MIKQISYIFLIVLVIMSTFIPSVVLAVPSITLTPSTANIGSTVSISGSGFAPSVTTITPKNTTNAYTGTEMHNLSSGNFIEKFTGLPVGANVTGIVINGTGNGASVSGMIYRDDGYANSISNNYNASISAGFNGNVWVEPFSSLPVGNKITGFSLILLGGSANFRIKIYDNLNNAPNNLLGETASLANANRCIQMICFFPITATIPIGGKVWAGFETDSAFVNLGYTSLTSKFANFTAHTFSIVPSPFGVASGSTTTPFMQLQYNSTTSGYAKTKLFSSASSVGFNTASVLIPTSAIVPSSGSVWAGITATNAAMSLIAQNNLSFQSLVINTGSGSFVNPFTNSSDFNKAPWMRIIYSIPLSTVTLSTKLDGSSVTTNPVSPVTSSTGTFSGVTFTVPNVAVQATHKVNVTDSSNNFATANLIVPGASSFTLTGYILANNGIFNPPKITLSAPPTANVTSLMLFNGAGQLLSFQNFSPGIAITANVQSTIPATLQDNTNPSGTVSYYEQAVIQSGSTTSTLTSNTITLTYGTITNGNLNFNQTNTNTVPIYFIRNDLNKTDTRLSVIYPNTMNIKCNLGYQFAFVNQTYGPPLANVPYQGSNVNSSFKFHNVQNEIINVICTDTITNSTGRYVISQNVFPFQTQITQFRSGTFGTQGNFGIFDFVSLGVIIISMIGFNRKNESVGMFFSIGIIGVAAFYGIVTLPTFIIGAIVVIGVLAYTSTRKQSEVF